MPTGSINDLERNKFDSSGNVKFAAAGSVYVTPVALTSPPANLTAGANTALTFASTVYLITIHNRTTEDKQYKTGGAATAGDHDVLAGQWLEIPVPGGTTTLGIYGASASALNGTASGNVIVEGYA